MIPLTPQVRHLCHLMLQAVRYGAHILTWPSLNGSYSVIEGVRATLNQELALSLLSSRNMQLLGASLLTTGSNRGAWWVYITDTGRETLAEWDREEWGLPEPIPVGVLHTTRSPARYGCDDDTED